MQQIRFQFQEEDDCSLLSMWLSRASLTRLWLDMVVLSTSDRLAARPSDAPLHGLQGEALLGRGDALSDRGDTSPEAICEWISSSTGDLLGGASQSLGQKGDRGGNASPEDEARRIIGMAAGRKQRDKEPESQGRDCGGGGDQVPESEPLS
mmetsp:Transcript_22187/g.51011  ORF Transcript_22187/g.51011 Transcript_22187/m.51011 type:complete len:151 (+) Transcript_22187:455-907(+)